MKVEIEIDEYPQVRYALKTLEIEQLRLSNAIRKLGSSPRTAEDGAGDHEMCLDEIEAAISLIRTCVEAARHARQRERPAQSSKEPRAKQSNGPKPRDRGRRASDGEKKPA
jgi:hypothetical protein